MYADLVAVGLAIVISSDEIGDDIFLRSLTKASPLTRALFTLASGHGSAFNKGLVCKWARASFKK
jgi:hypothetical protein